MANHPVQSSVPQPFAHVFCRADKYACKHLEESARSYVRENFESVVLWDNEQPEHAGICSLSQTSLLQILSDDELVGSAFSCTAYIGSIR